MKKLNKLQINSEKLLQKDELIALRGGYGYVTCRLDGSPCGGWYQGWVGDCSMAEQACYTMCGEDWDTFVCVG